MVPPYGRLAKRHLQPGRLSRLVERGPGERAVQHFQELALAG